MGHRVSSIVQSGIEVGGFGAIHVAPITDRENIGNFESITPWTALSNDTTGIATDLAHVLGSLSLEFDKVDGAANQKYAGVSATITPIDLSRFGAQDKLISPFYVSSIADIDYVFVRLGTSVSHYNEWRVEDALPIVPAVWHVFSATVASTNVAIVGNGWTPSAVTYVSVGVMFDAETDVLADIRWDSLAIERAILMRT